MSEVKSLVRYQRLQRGGSFVLFSLNGKEKERPVNSFRGSRSRVRESRTPVPRDLPGAGEYAPL